MANEITQQKPARPLTPPTTAHAPGHVNGTTTPTRLPPQPASPAAPARPPKKGGLGFVFWLAMLLALAIVAWAIFHFYFQSHPAGASAGQATTKAGGGHHAGSNTIRVVPATATKGDIDVFLVGLGAVTPYNTVTIQARVSGQLMEVNFTDGQTVKAGDKLIQIDDRPYKALLEEYQAQKERDQALLDNANVDLGRYKVLYSQNSVQQQTLDTQEATVKQDKATVDSDQALIDQTQLNIDYCDIKSPIDGVVGLRLVDIGNQVTANSSNLLVVNQVQPIYVDFTIPEDNVPTVMAKLQTGQKLVVEALDRAQQKKLADGYLLTTDNQIDPQTGTLKLRALFENKENALFSNQFVNVKLLIETHKDVVLIPVAAIQYGTQGTFVYTINDDDPHNATVKMTPVTIAQMNGDDIVDKDQTEVQSGLDEGDDVVVDGVDKLADGSKVIVARKQSDTDTNAPAAANSVPSN